MDAKVTTYLQVQVPRTSAGSNAENKLLAWAMALALAHLPKEGDGCPGLREHFGAILFGGRGRQAGSSRYQLCLKIIISGLRHIIRYLINGTIPRTS